MDAQYMVVEFEEVMVGQGADDSREDVRFRVIGIYPARRAEWLARHGERRREAIRLDGGRSGWSAVHHYGHAGGEA